MKQLFIDDYMLAFVGQRAEIESAAAEALRHLPTESVIYYNLANFQGKMGLFSDSEINFLKAIELDPKNAGYYSNLGISIFFNIYFYFS